MNSSKNNRTHLRPLLLVLLFLAAICWSTLFGFASNWLMRSTGLYSYVIYLIQLFSFPFSMTCVVWLAGRRGSTGWATWTVPLILLVGEILVGILVGLVVGMIGTGSFLNFDLGDVLLYQWTNKTRALLFSFVFSAFLFRVSTLHLRPIESSSLPNRLTVLSILGLTALVAMGLGIDAVMNLVSSQRSSSMFATTALNYFYLAIGWLGLVVYLVFLSVYFFAILPEFMRRQLQENGVTISTIGFNYWVTFAICVLQIAIVFFCVGIMHLVGYRWDIRRRLLAEG